MKPTLIQQGAEAKIFLIKNTIIKDRVAKSYRHPKLDTQIRTRRTRAEAKILTKAYAIKANVPKLLHTEKHILTIEYIKGDRLSQTLNSYPEVKQIQTMQKLGKQVAKLHTHNIIHADLTTSNVILQTSPPTNEASHQRSVPPTKRPTNEASSKIYLIDFGLSYISHKTEDKAVDLHLIKQALEAKHFLIHDKLFIAFKKGYTHKESKEILKRLEIVESRGRYKH